MGPEVEAEASGPTSGRARFFHPQGRPNQSTDSGAFALSAVKASLYLNLAGHVLPVRDEMLPVQHAASLMICRWY
jgi:hypothetical protein